VSLINNPLPRHMHIIYEINKRHLDEVKKRYPDDIDRLRRMSLIEEGHEPQVRMAYLAIIGSQSVNGVARLHTELLKNGLVKDFYDYQPDKFTNKTNGITQRRWLHQANPRLADLITEAIGPEWLTDLHHLKKLEPLSTDAVFQQKWAEIKKHNKQRLSTYMEKHVGLYLNPDTIFDVQVKRIHEYKRQLLAVLHTISLYNELKSGTLRSIEPISLLISGKAAPGYHMAKLIIKLIHSVADVINHDPQTKDLLQIHFLPNYRVTLAEHIIPAADISEQISTAGTEASGTGNMKFALNGAITLGTMDGANVEIHEQVGEENIFIFGMLVEEVEKLRTTGYNPWEYINADESLKTVLRNLKNGDFSPRHPSLFQPIYESLTQGADRYMLCADYKAYREAHAAVRQEYAVGKWWEKSILNAARIGIFSSDRTIAQYNEQIWGVPVIPPPVR